MKPLVRHICRV